MTNDDSEFETPDVGYPAALYAAVHTGTPGDLSFYSKACGNTARILELGCGHGRVLRALADRPGRRCVGIELHDGLLEMARDELRTAPPTGDVELVRADMRTFDLDERFDRILLPHGSLYCLLEPTEIDACLARVREHLVPGGELWLDAYAADPFHTHNDPEEMADDALSHVKDVEVDGVVWEVVERSRWDREAQRVYATYVHTPAKGGSPVEGRLPHPYVLAEQLLAALLRAELEPIALFGGFDASPYDPDEADLMVVGARRTPLEDSAGDFNTVE